MRLKKMAEQSHTLTFRLTLWYGLIFTLSSFAAFLVFYFSAASVIQERTDDELMEEPAELFELFAKEGIDGVIGEVEKEIESEDMETMFLRVLARDGTIITSTDMSSWGNFGIGESVPEDLGSGGGPVLKTVSLPEKKYGTRVVSARIGPDVFMQCGLLMEYETEILSVFKTVFGTAMIIVLFIAGAVGWFMAKRALSGVGEVTRAADRIAQGDLDRRVPEKLRGTEIRQLAKTFNHMVDRIQKLVREMREMSDNIAHDLKSPITRIRGHAEVTLTTGGTREDYERMTAGTIEECDYLLEMIDTMLDISEIEAGANEREIGDVDLADLVRNLCDLFEPLAESKNIAIRPSVPDKLEIRGNSGKLQRMAANILDNAIKYTPENGRVAVSVFEDENGHAILSIDDTGIGIVQDHLPYIFHRFYRCDQSRSKTGSGLGLCLVKAIVKAHGGGITVKSEPDRGSSFSVTFPRVSRSGI